MKITDHFHESWEPIIPLLFQDTLRHLNQEVLPNIKYLPEKENIFKVFSMPVQDIKTVILGQDPYPNIGVPIGRAFAVSEETKIPVSLRIIEKEIHNSTGTRVPGDDDDCVSGSWRTLDHWEKQGVFLLNCALTVQANKAGSHLVHWEQFTNRVIEFISRTNPCVWMLWGRKSQEKRLYIHREPFFVHGYNRDNIKDIPKNDSYNYILQAAHPAAEAYRQGAGFYGCDHFHLANEILMGLRKEPIIW